LEKSIEVHRNIEQLIIELQTQDKLPGLAVSKGEGAFRIQSTEYRTANYFHAPNELKQLGRYNDPLCEKRVWYGAELPTGALAETFGRVRVPKERGIGTVLNQSDLALRNMCEVTVLKPLWLLDIKLLLIKLALTLDEITGPSYALTHEIVRVVSRLPGSPFDGIAYESRHYSDGRMCYALWIDPGDQPLVSEGKIENLCEYVYKGELARPYDGDDIDAEEMLTEVLGYKVT